MGVFSRYASGAMALTLGILAVPASLSAQTYRASDIAGFWAFEAGGCQFDDGHIQLHADGYYYSACEEGSWRVDGTTITVVAQNVVDDMCYAQPSAPATHTGTIHAVTDQTMTVTWNTTGVTIEHLRCP